MYYTSKDKSEILNLIVEHGVGANAYFTISINESAGGDAPRRANYSSNEQLARVVYCHNEQQVTPDGEITTNLQASESAIACAFFDTATPTGNDSQRGCSPYTGSIQTQASFRYVRFYNCAPRCLRYTKDVTTGTIFDDAYDSLPLNEDECETYGSDPTYFWYHVEYNVVTKIFGLPLFENESDAATFSLACSAYIANPTPENLRALQGALAVSLNDGVIPKMSKEPSSEAGYGQLLPDGMIAGVGTFDDTSDHIGLDPLPSVGVTSAGFINVYKITNGALATLGEKIFPHFQLPELLTDPASMDVKDVLLGFLQVTYGAILLPTGAGQLPLANDLGVIDILMNGKLIDYILDCHIVPCTLAGSTTEALKIGYRQFNDMVLEKATSDYVRVECGSLNIGEYFASFLDYANVTCEVFLPFVGYVPIDSEYWNGGTISVTYDINVIDGSFQAKIKSTSGKSNLNDTVIAQYGGVACIHLPITGLNYSNVVSGLVNGAIGTTTSAMSGNVGGAVTNLANMAMLRPDNPMSNGYNASSSFLSQRTPYLVIKRPTPQFSSLYPKEIGAPMNVARKLSSVKGFTIIDNPVLNIACNDKEYAEICSLLKAGVIL